MTTDFGYPQAFDQVADAALKAKGLRSADVARERVKSLIVEHETDRAEVQVAIQDAAVQTLRIDDIWFEDASAQDVERLVKTCINEALTQWNEQSLEALRNATPEIAEVSDALERARNGVRRAFDNEIERIRNEY